MIPEPHWSNQSPSLSLRQCRGPGLAVLIHNHIFSWMMMKGVPGNISRASLYAYLVHSYIFSAILVWFTWNTKHIFQNIHYNNWVIRNTPLAKISACEHRTKWILYQELPAHFRQKPKHAAKKEKALTEIEEKRVNYSSVILIMVGFLKQL